jgi:hypothetical protein
MHVAVKNGKMIETTIRKDRQKCLAALAAINGYATIVQTGPERNAWAERNGFVVQKCEVRLCD